MTKWEYKVEILEPHMEGGIHTNIRWADQLNALGKEGWELVSMTPYVWSFRATFKREKATRWGTVGEFATGQES